MKAERGGVREGQGGLSVGWKAPYRRQQVPGNGRSSEWLGYLLGT